MRPPICAICHKDFGPEEGGLVSFATDAEAREWHRRAQAEPGFVGHPPEQEWFCGRHLTTARKWSHLSLGEAMAKIRSEL